MAFLTRSGAVMGKTKNAPPPPVSNGASRESFCSAKKLMGKGF
jgi:hypothetical protein